MKGTTINTREESKSLNCLAKAMFQDDVSVLVKPDITMLEYLY